MPTYARRLIFHIPLQVFVVLVAIGFVNAQSSVNNQSFASLVDAYDQQSIPCTINGSCDDFNPETINDTYDANCVCRGSLLPGEYGLFSKIVGADRHSGDAFGHSIDVDGHYVVVGALGNDYDNDNLNYVPTAGAAFVYQIIDGEWHFVQKLVASDRKNSAAFGKSVSISGDYIVVGAYQDDYYDVNGDTLNASGAAYVYKRTNDSWTQVQKLISVDYEENDQFGSKVAIDGDIIVIAADFEDEDESGGNTMLSAGAVYVYERIEDTWIPRQKIVANDRSSSDLFGSSIAVSGSVIVVGATGEDEDGSGGGTISNAGSVYIFDRTDTLWTQMQKINASDRDTSDRFGSSVSIHEGRVVVGTWTEDEDQYGENTLSSAGSIYVFEYNGSEWGYSEKIVAPDRAANDAFGYSVALGDNLIVVGARTEDEDSAGDNSVPNAGSVYLFEKDSAGWILKQKLVAPDRDFADVLGWDVAMDGTTIAVAAPFEDEDEFGENTLLSAGSVYMFGLGEPVSVHVKVLLAGALEDSSSWMMRDDLRIGLLVPLLEPYSDLGYLGYPQGGETTNDSILSVSGSDAIVDWIRLELRSPSLLGLGSIVIATRHCLLQRDGDVVNPEDGSSPVFFNVPEGEYMIAVRHRNHLGCITSAPLSLSVVPILVDFRLSSTVVWGTNPRKQVGDVLALWSGNTLSSTPNGLKYTGQGNDRDPILLMIGGAIPTAVISGYHVEDVNLDGRVKYVGENKDRDPILLNVGGSVPTNQRFEQLP